MKRFLLVCAAVMALLTHAHAFNFGGIIKDMKDSVVSVKNSAKDSVEIIKEDTILHSDDREVEEDPVGKAEAKFEEEKKEFEEKLGKLTEELTVLKEKNKALNMSLAKSESEKSTFEHYVEFLILLIVLILLFSLFVCRSMHTGKSKEEK